MTNPAIIYIAVSFFLIIFIWLAYSMYKNKRQKGETQEYYDNEFKEPEEEIETEDENTGD